MASCSGKTGGTFGGTMCRLDDTAGGRGRWPNPTAAQTARMRPITSFRKGGGLVDAPGRRVVPAKDKYAHCPVICFRARSSASVPTRATKPVVSPPHLHQRTASFAQARAASAAPAAAPERQFPAVVYRVAAPRDRKSVV